MLSLLCSVPSLPPAAPPAVMVVEVATGHVFLPATGKFGPADGSELTPSVPVAGSSPNVAGLFCAVLPSFPDARAAGQYAVTLHPSGGGGPIAAPVPVPASAPSVKIQVSVGP